MGVATLREPQQLDSFQSLTLGTDEGRSTLLPVIAVAHSESSVETGQPLCPLTERPHLLFSHLEHSTCYDEGANSSGSGTCCSCRHWNGATPDHYAGLECPACSGDGARVTDQNSDEDIITSFNSLSVTNSDGRSLRSVHSNGATGSHLSCRQQAVTYGGPVRHFDDTTVEDLAGYLDEIMFLPKPMSEMAELMYT